MVDFISALGLALVIEGVFYALFADRLPAMLQIVAAQPPAVIRAGGMVAAVAGLGLVWLMRG